uniref:Uncharacterized protein n=1 Tax=Ditylenchus dipsaci TaxID=166011 RepID=A0A915EM78_9BILA
MRNSSFTSDVWTNQSSGFISLTAHGINEYGREKSSSYAFESLEEVTLAFEVGGYEHADCAAHKINRIVKNGIFGNERIATLLKKGRAIVTHFSHSPEAYERLRVEQKKRGFFNKPLDTGIYGLATFLDARFKDRLSEGRTCFREQGTGWIEQEAKDLIVDTDSVEHQKDVSSPLLPVEQLFSVAWNVFHYRRFNLAPRNAELLVFLNKVLSLLHYQY